MYQIHIAHYQKPSIKAKKITLLLFYQGINISNFDDLLAGGCPGGCGPGNCGGAGTPAFCCGSNCCC